MKRFLHIAFILFFIIFSILIVSCKNNDDNSDVGFSDAIKNFVPDSTIQTLRDLGMKIHEGKNPPDIQGYYWFRDIAMISSNVPNESHDINSEWVDYLYHLYNQDNKKLEIDVETDGFDGEENRSHTAGKGSFLSGNSNYFSVFSIQDGKATQYHDSDTAFYRSLDLISGKMTEAGIVDFQHAFMMLDDYGDPLDVLIPINSGRIFIDGDSLAIRTFTDMVDAQFKKPEITFKLPQSYFKPEP